MFSHRSELNPNKLTDSLNKELKVETPPDEIVIAVPDPALKDANELCRKHPILSTQLERLSVRSAVTLIGFDIHGDDTNTINFKDRKPLHTISLKTLSRRIITNIFQKYDGFVEANESFHFENPSGRHTKRFLRLSNLLNNSDEIGYIAFACLPYIKSGIEAIYIDTPSLHIVVSAINEIRFTFNLPLLGAKNFQSYKWLENIGNEVDVNSLVMISASSTGGLARQLIEKYEMQQENILHLLFFGKSISAGNVVCDLSYNQTKNPFGISEFTEVFEKNDCKYCKFGSSVVQIQGDQFDITDSKPEPIMIRKLDAPTGLRNALRSFIGRKALTIHMQKDTSSLKRDYEIDFTNIATESKYKSNLQYVLKRFVPIGTEHIISINGSTKILANEVQEFITNYGGEAKVIDVDEVYRYSSFNEKPIIVTADVIESGRCLTTVSQALRSSAMNSPIVYIVGVEKTSNTRERKMLKSTLTQCNQVVGHEYIAVEKIVLPVSTGRNAWHDELEFLQDMKSKKRDLVTEYFDRRISELKKLSIPLIDNLFLTSIDGYRLKIQEGFVFWPEEYDPSETSQAEVYYTISSVLQNLRTTGKIKNFWHHRTMIHPNNFIRFNDGVIRASLLRASRLGELDFSEYETESTEMKNIILNAFRSASSPAGYDSPEFLMALGTKKLRLKPDDHNSVVDVGRTMNGVIKELSDCIEKI